MDSDEKDSTKLHHFQLLDSVGRVLGRRHQALLWKQGRLWGTWHRDGHMHGEVV